MARPLCTVADVVSGQPSLRPASGASTVRPHTWGSCIFLSEQKADSPSVIVPSSHPSRHPAPVHGSRSACSHSAPFDCVDFDWMNVCSIGYVYSPHCTAPMTVESRTVNSLCAQSCVASSDTRHRFVGRDFSAAVGGCAATPRVREPGRSAVAPAYGVQVVKKMVQLLDDPNSEVQNKAVEWCVRVCLHWFSAIGSRSTVYNSSLVPPSPIAFGCATMYDD